MQRLDSFAPLRGCQWRVRGDDVLHSSHSSFRVACNTLVASCRQTSLLKAFFWLVSLAIIPAGCVQYQPQPIHLDQSAAVLDARSLSNPQLRRFLEVNVGTNLPSSMSAV